VATLQGYISTRELCHWVMRYHLTETYGAEASCEATANNNQINAILAALSA
jgi:hypothetical protein